MLFFSPISEYIPVIKRCGLRGSRTADTFLGITLAESSSFSSALSESVGQEGYYYRGYNYAIFAGWLSSLFRARIACLRGWVLGWVAWCGLGLPARLPSHQAVSPPMFSPFSFLFLCGLFGVKFRLGGLISHEFGGGGRPN